jgi:hypothetical protein
MNKQREISGVFDKLSCLRDCVDVGLMTSEGLSGLAAANIPELSARIAGSGDEGVVVGSEREAACKYERCEDQVT